MQIPCSGLVACGLSMPHSPRWHEGRPWLLNSGAGGPGFVGGGRFQPVTDCPGFVGGLALVGGLAVVALSMLRPTSLNGFALDERLDAENQASSGGLRSTGLQTGRVVHSLHIDGVVEAVRRDRVARRASALRAGFPGRHRRPAGQLPGVGSAGGPIPAHLQKLAGRLFGRFLVPSARANEHTS